MTKNRRLFLKQLLLGGSALAAAPMHSFSSPSIAEQDSKQIQKKVSVHILQTTDVHCQIKPHDELFWENNQKVFKKTGGYASLATFIENYKKKYQHSFLVDTGDMFQGSQLSVETTGNALVPLLNKLGYDLYLPGNWEVVYYKSQMQRLLGGLNAPKICANMYHQNPDGSKGALIFIPYYIWHIQGLKIGFLGYTDHLVPIRQSPAYSKGIVYTKPEENLAHYIQVLKEQEKCNYLIMLAHLGLSQQIALANNEACAGLDIILGGDTHERIRKPIVCKYAKVVEPGAFGSFVGGLELTFEEGKLVQEKYTLHTIEAQKYRPNKAVQNLINQIESPLIAQMEKIIGYSTIPLYRYFVIENTIDTLVLDAIRWQISDVDLVLSNGFRFCPPRSTPDATGNIPITNGYIYDMLPVNSRIRRGKVSGKQLKNWLEKELNNVFAAAAAERFGGWVVKFDGMKVKFYAYGENGKRVTEVLINGEPLNLDLFYSIVACEREGDPDDMLCRFTDVKDTTNTPFSLHDTLIRYLQANSPVTPTPKQHAIALDASPQLLTQVWGVNYAFE